ncbi:hypothetical protein BRE01_10920 [Brevibacillus reuszeri]|uniref:Uncharacterized protein n=1 Tax=Brevibacillus reuszeri TaxID=54915 RepID=A0A0K9YU41_9BACL|nr:hypothetical protein ADS79_23465 [Brevibacillus reuszeri]GED67390.1 hypothetical protein BRE01_10920 [Brevibacillus reuszeri]
MKPGNHCTCTVRCQFLQNLTGVLTDEEEDGLGRKLFLREEFFFCENVSTFFMKTRGNLRTIK